VPKVSFIIPLFNCLELTKACLASLQATVPRGLDYEILLIDDGSTDGTREWLQTLGAPVRVLLNEKNLGYAVSNNRGAREAKGEILGLLNNDLVLLPGWLPPILRFFRFGRRTGFVGNIQLDASTGAVDHSGIYIQESGKPAHRGAPGGAIRFRKVQQAIAVTGACAFVRRETFLQLGGFDEGFLNGGEDVDFCLRAREAGLRNWVALESRVLHHVSASPGRKERDEQNSRRLAARWRSTLAREAGRTWCRRFIADNWHEPRSLDARLALHALLAIWDVTDAPPREALWMTEQAMHREELRWEAILGPADATQPGVAPR
jgi:GT2 family glycosyltransferase